MKTNTFNGGPSLQKNIKNSGQKGIVMAIVVIVIALLILSYYGFNLRQTVESPATQSNFSYLWGGVVYVWDTYLQAPATIAYNFFIVNIWEPSIRDLQAINNNQLPSVEKHPPQLENPPYVQ